MNGDGWSSLSRNRQVMLILALAGVCYLLFQTRTSPTHMSNWGGNPFLSAANHTVAAEQAMQLQPRLKQPEAISGVAQAGRGASADADMPIGCPLQVANTVMTQGYGVGSHAPANVWGAVDLAIDGNHDGEADPDGSWGAAVYATHRGVVHLSRDTWPAGNHIWVDGATYKTGYSHLQGFAPGLQDGQTVERGQLIGFIGSTGSSSGPHLDYQVWKNGVNVNPLDYGALDSPAAATQ